MTVQHLKPPKPLGDPADALAYYMQTCPRALAVKSCDCSACRVRLALRELRMVCAEVAQELRA